MNEDVYEIVNDPENKWGNIKTITMEHGSSFVEIMLKELVRSGYPYEDSTKKFNRFYIGLDSFIHWMKRDKWELKCISNNGETNFKEVAIIIDGFRNRNPNPKPVVNPPKNKPYYRKGSYKNE